MHTANLDISLICITVCGQSSYLRLWPLHQTFTGLYHISAVSDARI